MRSRAGPAMAGQPTPVRVVALSFGGEEPVTRASSPNTVVCGSLGEFAHALPSGDVGVAWVDVLQTNLIEALCEASRRSNKRLVIVSPLSADALPVVDRLPASVRVVWTEKQADHLAEAIEAADVGFCAVFVERLVSMVGRGSPFTTRALRRLAGGVPYKSVDTWAEAMRTRPANLRYHLRRGLPGLSPKGLVDWVLLLRALELREARAADWSRIASWLGVHRRTMERTAKRLTGHTLHELSRDRDRVVAMTWRWVEGRTPSDPVSGP